MTPSLKSIGLGIVIVFILITLFGTYYTIGAGERGVLTTWGRPDQVSIEPGLHFKIPFVQGIEKFSVQTLKYEANATAASKDLQTVHTKVAVNYHLLPSAVPQIYTQLGYNYEDRVIQPAVQEVVKATTVLFSAEELVTKREIVKDQIQSSLMIRLAKENIIVEAVSITNFDFSESFNQAIEAKVTAQQQKQKAEMDYQRIQVEVKSKVAEAQGQAQALEMQKNAVTPELVRLREIEMQSKAVEKWDGKMPQVTSGAMPFFNVAA